MAKYQPVRDEIVRDGAGKDSGGVGDFSGQAGVDEQGGEDEIRREGCGLGKLVAPVSAQPSPQANRPPLAGTPERTIAERPPAVSGKILKSCQFQRNRRGRKRGPVEMADQQRQRADLGDEPADTDRVEDTPPPKINPHINVCELCAKTGSQAPAWADGRRGEQRR